MRISEDLARIIELANADGSVVEYTENSLKVTFQYVYHEKNHDCAATAAVVECFPNDPRRTYIIHALPECTNSTVLGSYVDTLQLANQFVTHLLTAGYASKK